MEFMLSSWFDDDNDFWGGSLFEYFPQQVENDLFINNQNITFNISNKE